jgi:hypothetical protein
VVPLAATALADIDDLAKGGLGLLAGTHDLASGLMQEFGYPEARQVSSEGNLRIRYWIPEFHKLLRRWAGENGVTVTEETVG